MTKWGVAALLLALLPASRAQAQVWYSRSSYHGGSSGAVARYSTPFLPAYGAARASGPRPQQFTWYSVSQGYSYGPQTGLPWRAHDLEYRRRGAPPAEAGSSVVAFSRAFRPSRRAYYESDPIRGSEEIARRRQSDEAALRHASDRQKIDNPRSATAPARP